MSAIISFIGWHNSGKTTLIREVARALMARGYEIAVIKSTKHALIQPDPPGTDTELFQREGIGSIALVGPSCLRLTQKNAGEPLLDLAVRLFPDADLVIAEGFKNAPDIPKLEVFRAEIPETPLRDQVPGVIAVVSDDPVETLLPVFSRRDPAVLAAFIEQKILGVEKVR